MQQHRTWADLSGEEMAQAAALYRDKNVNGLKALVAELHTTPETLFRQIRQYNLIESKIAQRIAASARFPEPPNKPYTTFAVKERASAIVISDIEIPDHDPWMLKAALLVGMKRGIRTLIYNGDVFATDQTALNSWVTTWKEEKDVSFATAIHMGDNVFLNFGKWFTEQFFVSGNHDERINKKSGGEIFLELIYRDSPVKFSMYAHLCIHRSLSSPKR